MPKEPLHPQLLTTELQLDNLIHALLWARNRQVPIRFLLDMEEALWMDSGDQISLLPNGHAALQSPEGDEFPLEYIINQNSLPCKGVYLNIWLEKRKVFGF